MHLGPDITFEMQGHSLLNGKENSDAILPGNWNDFLRNTKLKADTRELRMVDQRHCSNAFFFLGQ